MNPKHPSEMGDRERDDVRIGRNVRQYRLTRKYTQGELAAKSGVTAARICQIENGAGCSVSVFMRLCHALRAEPLDVMAWRHWQRERERVQAARGTR